MSAQMIKGSWKMIVMDFMKIKNALIIKLRNKFEDVKKTFLPGYPCIRRYFIPILFKYGRI